MAKSAGIRGEVDRIADDERLKKDLENLPANYNFEIAKTIWKIRSTHSKHGSCCRDLPHPVFAVALQFPEGLLLYACIISDLLERYTDCDTVIMADVTYGACCVDDYTARALGCDLLVHYGHSCLVPIQDTQGIHMLYIFVNIAMNLTDFVDSIKANFPSDKSIALVATIQFVPYLQSVKSALESSGFSKIAIPQCKPLSPGEILGCTAPRVPPNTDLLLYLGDGRFHLESMMIANPRIAAYQYDPYSRKLTHEVYDHAVMLKTRSTAINAARDARLFGLIQGTLGRQGNERIVLDLEDKLHRHGKRFVRVLLSEIFPDKLNQFEHIDCWVQVACPRLSIDWGASFSRPLLTPYELAVALDEIDFKSDSYPMDYYATQSLGPWTNNHETHRAARPTRRPHIAIGQS